MPLQLFKIADTTIATPQASITFSSIPSGYTDLKLVLSTRDTNTNSTNAFANINMTFNGDGGSNYSSRLIYSLGAGLGNSGLATASGIGVIYHTSASATANTFGNAEVYIPNYTVAQNKSVSSEGQSETNATAGFIYLTAAQWNNTAAITTINLQSMTTFAAGSTATLYGVL